MRADFDVDATPTTAVSTDVPTRKPRHARVGRLVVFHMLNVTLGAVAFTPAIVLGLLFFLPRWLLGDSVSICGIPRLFSSISRFLATIDIDLANFAAPYLRKPAQDIRRSPYLDIGDDAAVVKVYLYFSTVKLLIAFGSLIAVHSSIGMLVLSVISIARGDDASIGFGIPGLTATFTIKEQPIAYIAVLLLCIMGGCLCVLQTAPQSVKLTKRFCGWKDNDLKSNPLLDVGSKEEA